MTHSLIERMNWLIAVLGTPQEAKARADLDEEVAAWFGVTQS